MIHLFNLLIMLLAAVIVILLQIRLSKTESKWPGLLLPLIFFCLSAAAVLGLAGFVYSTHEQVFADSVVGQVGGSLHHSVLSPSSTKDLLFQSAVIFLCANLPTLLLLGIYAAVRDQRKKQSALEKMRIQDLK